MSREDFIQELNSHSARAYKQLYDEYYKALVLYVDKIVDSEEGAEDIVQSVFVSMWEKKVVFASYAAFTTYIYKAVRHVAFNVLRHKEVEQLYVQHLENSSHDPEPDEVFDVEEVHRMLLQAIDQLTPRQREIFLLRLSNKKNEEIAQMMDISVETVKTQVKRALKTLRQLLGSYWMMLIIETLTNSQ